MKNEQMPQGNIEIIAHEFEETPDVPAVSIFPDRHDGHMISFLKHHGLDPEKATDGEISLVMTDYLKENGTYGISNHPGTHRY